MTRRCAKTGRRPEARAGKLSPLKRSFYGLLDFIDGIGQAQLGVYASSGAFFLFLSLVPIVVLACSILPLTALSQESVLEYISAILPDVMQDLLREIVGQVYGDTVALLSLSALLILWSASKSFVGLYRGLNRIYGSSQPPGFFRARVASALYTLLLLATMLISLAFIVFQRRLLGLLAAAWPQSGGLVDFLMQFRFLAAMLLLALFFALLYKFMPARRLRFARQLPGALLGSALWMLLSWFFSFYVRNFSGANIYGSLATVIFALLWIYWCMYVILLGGYVNVCLERLREADELAE